MSSLKIPWCDFYKTFAGYAVTRIRTGVTSDLQFDFSTTKGPNH